MNYLFVGEDEFSKDARLHKIKQELFLAELESFNFEIIYPKALDLKTLQEKLLLLPVKAKQRLILVRDIQRLKPNIKDYLLSFLKKPFGHVSLILDARRDDRRDKFLSGISRFVKVLNFRQSAEINAFSLARQIVHVQASLRSESRQSSLAPAMKLLRQLLLQGEKPEKILGAIRYQLGRQNSSLADKKKKLNSLLKCDIDIKTGKLKPDLALERLVIRLCCF